MTTESLFQQKLDDRFNEFIKKLKVVKIDEEVSSYDGKEFIHYFWGAQQGNEEELIEYFINGLPKPEAGDTVYIRSWPSITDKELHARLFFKEATNPTGLIPLEYHLLVLPDPVDDKIVSSTGFSLIKPTDSTATRREQAKQQKATVVFISTNCFEGWPIFPAVGDKVLIDQYAGMFWKGKDGIEYRLIKDEEIKAIIES